MLILLLSEKFFRLSPAKADSVIFVLFCVYVLWYVYDLGNSKDFLVCYIVLNNMSRLKNC